jgi:GNAT superfamily N-acetyltransferase
VHAVFATADGAIGAIDAQIAMGTESWDVSEPLRVRIGIHSGAAELREGDYFGSAVNRAARLEAAAHGGQIVCSQAPKRCARRGAHCRGGSGPARRRPRQQHPDPRLDRPGRARPELVPTVARWHWDLWGAEDPAGSLESWTARVARWANHDAVPMIFIALAGETAVGSVSLVSHDLTERRDLWDLWPWLSGLYVVPGYRGRGVGRAFVARIEAQARSMVVVRLYLYTAQARGLYEQLGWHRIGDDVAAGTAVTIMVKRVDDTELFSRT